MKEDIPSKTALIVAVILIMVGSTGRHDDVKILAPPDAAKIQVQLLQHCSNVSGVPFWLLTNQWFASFMVWMSGILVVPQFMQGLGFRKIFMERSVRHFLNNKQNKQQSSRKAQVLILAGGYDTLALRLCNEFQDVFFWEIDHPATSQQKSNAATKLGTLPMNLRFIAADLTKRTLQQVLKQDSQFDPSLPTIAILEGLLFYLEEQHVKELFASLSEVTGPGSQAAFDYLGLTQDGNYNNGWMTSIQSALVSKMGEKWHWAIHPSNLGAFFEDMSWEVKEQAPRVGLEHCALVELKT